MNKVLFINGYVYLPGESALKRTVYLFELALSKGYEATLLTSDFNHYAKEVRDIENFYVDYPQYKDTIKFIKMKPYQNNISVRRYLNGNQFERNAVKWFEKNGLAYDMVYLSLPAAIIADKIRPLCNRFGTKLVIDVNDLWPDSLRLFLKKEWLYKLCTYPIGRHVSKGYGNADCIVAVSDEYRKIAEAVNTRYTSSKTVYIGAMLEQFDEGVKRYSPHITKPSNEFWVIYAGTLGASYDIATVIRAVDELYKAGYHNIKFKIFGKGPEEEKLRYLAENLNSKNIEFCGFVDYDKLAAYLSVSDVSVNCIKSRASQSIINKIADYFAAGKPVLNCGSCVEMHDMIIRYEVGYNYEAENATVLAEKIKYVMNNPSDATKKGGNARKLAETEFDRLKTHTELLEFLDRI